MSKILEIGKYSIYPSTPPHAQMVLETCELCLKEKSATYVQLRVGIIGAALCPSCYKISQRDSFKKELAHMLATGQGDLEKFLRIGKATPKCRLCECELKTSNWSEGCQKKRDKICMTCNGKKIRHYHEKQGLKIDSGENIELLSTASSGTITLRNAVQGINDRCLG